MAMIALNKVVDVGLVTGVIPAKTPSGSATVINSSALLSSITPTVWCLRMWCQISSVANMFLIALSSTTPRPVSFTASIANSMCLSCPASTIWWVM